MQNKINVCIGIQARSTSERFPRKAYELIDGKPLLKHVIDTCDKCAMYMNRFQHKNGITVHVSVLTPYGDSIAKDFRGKAHMFEGSEHDVLERYKKMSDELNADYVVRITGDCPMIPAYLITKHIKAAIMNRYDYISNVDEQVRTSPDGMDCEVISKALIDYAFDKAVDEKDREHVTTYIRRDPPSWAKIGHIIGYTEMSDRKYSVDTPEDLERVRDEFKRIKEALAKAEGMHGKQNVHRF